MSEKPAFIEVKARTREEWIKDPTSYILIRPNRATAKIEVRIMSYEQTIKADYVGDFPEDVYYKIINDGHISSLQHAAYLGSELQKVFIAIKSGKDYVQDDNLKF